LTNPGEYLFWLRWSWSWSWGWSWCWSWGWGRGWSWGWCRGWSWGWGWSWGRGGTTSSNYPAQHYYHHNQPEYPSFIHFSYPPLKY
jgi:hypothetical protein